MNSFIKIIIRGRVIIFSNITSLFKFLPEKFTRSLANLPEAVIINATEVRLRLGSVFTLSVGDRSVAVDNDGHICSLSDGIRCTKQDIDDCMSLLSSFSLYSFDETIRKGYIPLPGGGRAGICGMSVCDKAEITAFSSIYSINLRIHRLYRYFAGQLIEYYKKFGLGGTLVFSPPALGKTTLLRSAAVLLSEESNGIPLKVVIVDERCELFLPGMCGGLIDVISGCPKSEGIELVTRTMSPQVIICDEIAQSDCDALINAQNSGVILIASAHGRDFESICRRPFIKRMVDSGIFEYAVKIDDNFRYEIERI